MIDESKGDVYRYIDPALPIQNKDPVKTKSLLEFVLQEPGDLKQAVTDAQELHKLGDKYFFSKKDLHQIG